MKCPQYDIAKAKRNMEKDPAEKAFGLHVKNSPSKEPLPLKPLCPPAEKVSTVLASHHSTLGVIHDKENQTLKEHERNPEEALEDSGYMSLQNSQTEEDYDHGQARPLKILLQPLSPQKDEASPKRSTLFQEGTGSGTMTLVAASTPVNHCRRQVLQYSLSSTPSEHHENSNLPIMKFQQAVCKELHKSYLKTKRYDWSIISKVAEDHLLHQVIGRQMGLEYVDVFSSLLSKNMRCILANILALLGDLDLISCRKVSRTWRKIICEDGAALRRCEQAEQMLQESVSSVKLKDCDLTRDMAVSRVVLSCVQKVASPHHLSASPSLSTNSGVNRRIAPAQKGTSQRSRFKEFMQAASSLKQHQSLRRCIHCGSPATHSAKVQRATCTRPTCQFDFCTCCQEAFHGSTPCRMMTSWSHITSPKSTPILPGSCQSKRNVRRL
ncbi:F-box only protein 5 [Dunckerocampus dactyliophorus]|uniref:F-box only protein 5 n=1 Tax=Dunckerocampus dactyliophorus TaxID=161453 RepID=UPI002406631F|nr:F-box only protein 5 [Dunckerocampus dactyliophorus]